MLEHRPHLSKPGPPSSGLGAVRAQRSPGKGDADTAPPPASHRDIPTCGSTQKDASRWVALSGVDLRFAVSGEENTVFIFPQLWMMKNFKCIEKLREFYSEYPDIHMVCL